jgi:glycosyltransferase involved in cell wall biosynthesis
MTGGLSQAVAIWLDVTRLVTRAGRGVLTGIDRVELAYLDHLLAQDCAATRFLLRSTRGYLLLDRHGGARLSGYLHGTEDIPDRGDLISRAYGKGTKPRHRVERGLRPLAVDRCLRRGLPRLLGRRAPSRFAYLNTGHANLSGATLGAMAGRPGCCVAVMIHDVIPITHPDLVADGMPERFAGRLARVRRSAHLVICNSRATRAALYALWRDTGQRPATMVAHLGIETPPAAAGPRDPGRFVMLGTIEPRKNHAMILDVWEGLADRLPPGAMPDLHVIGPTGWKVEALMNRLRAHPLTGRSIHLHGPLPEDEMRAHLGRATALLFPSLAEGYGYPPLEAAAAGALPICSDLPVFRETLGESAVYLDVTDTYSWMATIEKLVLGMADLPRLPPVECPDWGGHFDRVGRALADHRAEGP